AGVAGATNASSPPSPRFLRTRRFDAQHRDWTIVYRSSPAFEANSLLGLTWLVLAADGVASCLLFALTAAQAALQTRAERAAEELRASHRALRVSENRFRRLVDSNLIGVVFSTLDGR